MSRKFRSFSRAAASSLALAATVTLGLTATSASAQSAPRGKQAPAKSGNSPAFAKVYAPIAAQASAPTADFAALKAQIPAVLAAAANEDDRHVAGNFIVVVGNKLKDPALQRQGLEMMIASGKVAPDKIGEYNYLAGSLAYQAKDYAAARTGLLAAQTAGYQNEDLPGLLAETYFQQNQNAEGLASLKTAIVARRAAGTPVADSWLLRGLQVAFNNKMGPQTNEWAAMLASTNPSPKNWAQAIQVVGATNNFDPGAELDMLRLMSLTNSMTQQRDYLNYIEAADPRIMSNEVSGVLQRGLAAGLFKPSDIFYSDTKKIIDTRMAADRADAPKLLTEARAAAAGTKALSAGDVQYSLGQYANAEEMYQLALTKGGVDNDKALTRLGIAQAQQGKTAEAKANFAKVSGARAPIAQMWLAYLATKA